MAKKKKNFNPVILIIIIVVLVIIITILLLVSKKSSKADINTPGQLGNLPGNINNEGLFCESGGKVYFCNTLDNYYIYSMDPDGSNIKKLQEISSKYLNAGGDFLYYNQSSSGQDSVYGFAGNMNGIYRLSLGKRKVTKGLDRIDARQLLLLGNNVYYQHYDNSNGMTLYKCSVNGGDRTEALKEIVNLSCVLNETICYPDQNNNFYLNSFDTNNFTTSLLLNIKMYNPVYNDGYIYYISIDDDYALARCDISTKNTELLTKDRVDCFNIMGNVLFYQKNDKNEPALIRMNADGSSPVIIANGNYTNINMTSVYTYFFAYDNPKTIYKVSTAGSPTPSVFTPEIITEQKKKFKLGGKR
ncbi:MAG: DUF5050 domain-containing protein [Lachnospiraceae bacterium]|nr:DUF5050 domain-containing protein [Lachnospiraceae bacterium]